MSYGKIRLLWTKNGFREMVRIIGNILFIHISYLTKYNKSLLRQRRQKGRGGLMYFGIDFQMG